MLLDCSADAASIPFRDKVINIPFLKQFEAAIQAAASMLSARVRLRSSLVHVCVVLARAWSVVFVWGRLED